MYNSHFEEKVTMSSQKLRSFSRFLAIGSAALLIQIGAAAGANQPDIHEQMSEVLSGAVVAHAIPRSVSGREASSESRTDDQAFARRLLQGWSASPVSVAHPAQRPRRLAAAPEAHPDIQAMVRRQLLGA